MSNISDKPWLVPGHMYQYDIGWLVDKLLSFETELNTAIDLKTIHYADPIQWDITTQYSPNTVVVDPKTGTAYMSKVPVPAGILLTNTDYWVVIFNYQRIYNKIMAGIAYNEEDNLYASKDFAINDLVWYGGDLYRCIKEIAEGGKFVVDANITPTTIESLLDNYYGKNRTAHVASDTITADRDITESAANKNVTVTGNIAESAANKNVTVTGNIAESAANKNVTVTGDITETANNITLHSKQDILIDADGSMTEQITGGKTSEVRGAFTEIYDGTATSTYQGKRIMTAKDVSATMDNINITAKSAILHLPDKDVDLANIKSRGVLEFLEKRTDVRYGTDSVINALQALESDGNFVYAIYSTNGKINLVKYSYDLSTIVKSVTLDYGHINDMCHVSGYLYLVDPAVGIVKIDAGNLAVVSSSSAFYPAAITHNGENFVIITTESSTYGFSFVEIDNNFSYIDKHNIVIYNLSGVNQLVLCYKDGLYYMPMSSPSYMAVFNSDFTPAYIFEYPKYTEHHMLAESDGMCAYGDGFLFGFNTPLNLIRTAMECNILYSNLATGESSRTNRIFGKYAQAATIGMHVNPDATNIVQDGSAEYPFLEIGQAINAYNDYKGEKRITLAAEKSYARVDAAGVNFNLNSSGNVTIDGIHLKNSNLVLTEGNFTISNLAERDGVGIWIEMGSSLITNETSAAVEAGTGSTAVLLSKGTPYKQSSGVVSFNTGPYLDQHKTSNSGAFLGKSKLYSGSFANSVEFRTDAGYYALKYVQISIPSVGTFIQPWNNQMVTFSAIVNNKLYLITYKITTTNGSTYTMTRVGKVLDFSNNTWSDYANAGETMTIFGVI